MCKLTLERNAMRNAENAYRLMKQAKTLEVYQYWRSIKLHWVKAMAQAGIKNSVVEFHQAFNLI